MALEPKDLKAIRLLMDEIAGPLERRIGNSIAQLRNEMLSNFDALFLRDEKRDQENVLRDEQLRRLEERVGVLEKKVA